MTWRLGRLTSGFASKLNLAADLLALVAAMVLGAWLSGRAPAPGDGEFWLLLAVLSVWTVVAASLRHYDPVAYERQALDDAALGSVLVLAVATVLALLHLFAPHVRGVPAVAPFLLFSWPTTLGLRGLFRALSSREQDPLDDVLIVGLGSIGRQTARDLLGRGRRRVQGLLRLATDTERDEGLLRTQLGATLPVLGDCNELERVLRAQPVGEVYIAGNARVHGAEMQAAIKVCEKLGVPFALPAYSFRLERARPADARGIRDGYVHYLAVDSKPHQMALKRLLDILASGAALWVLAPLLFAVAAAIKLTSRGPIFFKQVRVGLHGRPFHMLKFRSMVVDAEKLLADLAAKNEQTGPVFKMARDPRVTAIGRFIRKYSIDELPQLINVLRGEMSLVGPRPALPKEVARYDAWQLRRLSVRPGLTCIWQVSGRNQISFEQWMYLDLRYIDHWSLAQDLSLIARTLPVVLTGRGAS